MIGMHMHIGSQIKTTDPFRGAVVKGNGGEIVARLRKMGDPVAWCNMGGGLEISDRGHEARPITEFAKVILPGIQATGCRLARDPGRMIAGNAGILASRVLYTKQSGEKRFLIQDAAMNDLIRPALSASFPRIGPVTVPVSRPARPSRRLRGRDRGDRALGRGRTWTHVCESGDLLAKDCAFCPAPARPGRSAGDLLGRHLRHGHGPQRQHALPRSSSMGRTSVWSVDTKAMEDLVLQERL